MPRLTIRDQLIRGLERLGYAPDATYRARTERYEVFALRDGPPMRRVFVGKAGALRGGSTVTGSVPLDGLKARALAVGCGEKAP